MSSVKIPIGMQSVEGELVIPPTSRGIILFVHGSGSGRFSPRNRFVAQKLQDAGFATLLMDLLTPVEEEVDLRTAEFRFNIPLLVERVVGVIKWLTKNPKTKDFPVGVFGASTGAAAALIAAAEKPRVVKTVVSRGGRPDLAMEFLSKVHAATLLIIGGRDDVVIKMNQEALTHLRCVKKLKIVPEATHLFEEPGKLEMVAKLAVGWFKEHLR